MPRSIRESLESATQRIGSSRRLGGTRRDGSTRGGQNRYAPLNEFRHERWQSINLIERIAIFDRDVPALDKTGLAKTLPERRYERRRIFRRRGPHEPDHRHRWLLRPRYERPRCRCAAEKRDELGAGEHGRRHCEASHCGEHHLNISGRGSGTNPWRLGISTRGSVWESSTIDLSIILASARM